MGKPKANMLDGERVSELRRHIGRMDLPAHKKLCQSADCIAWIGRNMFIRNQDHPKFRDAAACLLSLGVAVDMR